MYVGKIIGVIQARMGSSRLPGKSMKPLLGKPMLEHILDNVVSSKLVDKFVVATTALEEDDAIENLCKFLKIDCFRGEELNVLSRFKRISKIYKADILVRLTGDNPFVESSLIDYMLDKYFNLYSEYDYFHNVDNCNYPYGLSVEIFTSKALDEASKTTNIEDKEHVTRFF